MSPARSDPVKYSRFYYLPRIRSKKNRFVAKRAIRQKAVQLSSAAVQLASKTNRLVAPAVRLALDAGYLANPARKISRSTFRLRSSALHLASALGKDKRLRQTAASLASAAVSLGFPAKRLAAQASLLGYKARRISAPARALLSHAKTLSAGRRVRIRVGRRGRKTLVVTSPAVRINSKLKRVGLAASQLASKTVRLMGRRMGRVRSGFVRGGYGSSKSALLRKSLAKLRSAQAALTTLRSQVESLQSLAKK
jgi:hypothetical protein